jgi:hypothetical protein
MNFMSFVCFLLLLLTLFKPFLCLWLPHSFFLIIDALAPSPQTTDAVQLILLDISHVMGYLKLIFEHLDLRLDLRIEHGNCNTAHLNFTALLLIPLWHCLHPVDLRLDLSIGPGNCDTIHMNFLIHAALLLINERSFIFHLVEEDQR